MNKNKKWKETLNECRKNKNFMIGFVILVTVVLVAIFADVIAVGSRTRSSHTDNDRSCSWSCLRLFREMDRQDTNLHD